MKFIDDFLNNITMYRLVLYVLIFSLSVAVVLSLFGLLPFNSITLIISVSFLTLVCSLTNTFFAKLFKAPINLESVYITALILSLIITPIQSPYDLIFFSGFGVLAMASKYILAIKKKHIFNPAAFAIFLMSLISNNFATWWVGTIWMMPTVLIGGLLIVRKIRRSNLVFSFLFTSFILILGLNATSIGNILSILQKTILDTPILFFCFIMLTEPQTTPPSEMLQRIYGALVAFLFVFQIRLGPIFTTPEIALLIGNIFAYAISPKEKLFLKLKQRLQLAPDAYNFIFATDQKFAFVPGQYMEWTLGHKNPDSRGVRRYFTIASSPSEKDLIIGVKFYANPSSFKKNLLSLDMGGKIVASQLSGEFTLPKDANKKLAFLAGGIGITPFRSIISYLVDINQKRDIIILYSNKLAQDIVFKDIFDEALQKLEIKTVYVNTDKMGFIDEDMIKTEIPDYKDRIFYISGPHSMVDFFEKTLKDMKIPSNQIKVDFFPGYV